MGLFNFKFKKKNSSRALDFTDIDSMEKVKLLSEKGKLVPVYLMALRFGGVEDDSNAVYAPAVVAELKDRYDDMVENSLEQGKVKSYSATPQYKGKSFVPSSITITASGETTFMETINIW